ncbi:hypothetical protein [Spirosoma sp. KUDC1026]|uniref:hypothetical protein n=1 Tax=Spirosoma sp. KUDC1026 TaxID=2745947 RepID=UPI00159BC9EA|nr:hypothetical protein [Spirosoma sp. KUDC1026]QKZ14415.1 hypothetical protein HU175_17990 [Spirosoma sp. KUDC1026]
MKEETGVDRDETQINGRTDGPFGTDGADVDVRAEDNKHRADQEDSANGLDSLQVRGGQDGRNNRGIGSTDMDSKNGILRMGDQDNSTMEVPEEALNSAAASESKTNTATVDVTTSGPDDYASADQVDTPDAEKEAKEQDQTEDTSQESHDDVAETGTDLNNQPTY